MTSTPARKRESSSAIAAPRQTRSQLGLTRMLQAGRELIEASGNLDDLSINDIVERADTSIGAFYRRFDNKDAFFEVVQDQVMAEGLDYVHDMLERDPVWRSSDAGALADALVAFYVLVFRRNRGLYHASLLRSSQLKPSWDAAKEANREALALLVPRLVEALLAVRGAPPAEAAALEFEVRASVQMINGLLVNSILNDPGPLSLSSRRLRPWLQAAFRRCLGLSNG
ncbi:TetR/AcrR family transcriptional regulator [Paraburkholderia phenazinium]|jgi:AcrR family transcriptional regulator|uniref:DNA-binding transcriptional regulator, AcrR family n=1 Tax=Paraburkholderia phenazinium TaxID=60549 RepID=A0A1G7X4D4_9BURK|nr:TetR/AcrR family transcriptional regulator [Paraburkholderia phenazinium]SDG79021.1 DNA-binding transcriptional regulator, AcrR family [Paraburkholderia phenazinium]